MKNVCLSLIIMTLVACSGKPEAPANIAALPTSPTLCSPDYAGRMKIAIIIYNGVEAMDMTGPMDVFTKANYVHDHYSVYTVAAKDTMIYTERCNIVMQPRYTFQNCPAPDILVLPGCPPTVLQQLLSDTVFNNTVLAWIKQQSKNPETEIMSVCTGGMLLAKTGLLDGLPATTHYLALQEMQQMYPKVRVVGGVRFVDTLNFVTTAGITSGIDGALQLVQKFDGKMVADSTAHIMVYNRGIMPH